MKSEEFMNPCKIFARDDIVCNALIAGEKGTEICRYASMHVTIRLIIMLAYESADSEDIDLRGLTSLTRSERGVDFAGICISGRQMETGLVLSRLGQSLRLWR